MTRMPQELVACKATLSATGGPRLAVSWAPPAAPGVPLLHKYVLERAGWGGGSGGQGCSAQAPGQGAVQQWQWQVVAEVDDVQPAGSFMDEAGGGSGGGESDDVVMYRVSAWNLYGRSLYGTVTCKIRYDSGGVAEAEALPGYVLLPTAVAAAAAGAGGAAGADNSMPLASDAAGCAAARAAPDGVRALDPLYGGGGGGVSGPRGSALGPDVGPAPAPSSGSAQWSSVLLLVLPLVLRLLQLAVPMPRALGAATAPVWQGNFKWTLKYMAGLCIRLSLTVTVLFLAIQGVRQMVAGAMPLAPAESFVWWLALTLGVLIVTFSAWLTRVVIDTKRTAAIPSVAALVPCIEAGVAEPEDPCQDQPTCEPNLTNPCHTGLSGGAIGGGGMVGGGVLLPPWNWILQPKDITWERELGNGAFGEVFAGTYKGAKVAIKQVKPLLSESDSFALGKELSIDSPTLGKELSIDSPTLGKELSIDSPTLGKELSIMQALPPHERIAAFIGVVERPQAGGGLGLVMARYHTDLHRVDVWSWGVILYQMATWAEEPLYGGVRREALQYLYHTGHSHSPPRLCDDLPPGLDPAVASLLRDCLAEDPAARPPMEAVLQRLAGVRELPRPRGAGQPLA
ncbi:hypothetical protein TSOC_006553 [Tetrabaena socialis]|uniref:Serine-threonine/tyrosine-protein kinase catalytic domain-containing protein n=1 Tax=Tetrabaena socialis TaxID=47790 RepID=A0A2J8A3D5_9CHLO|nr:hypothetical protein TSOC_006553 [Tetrabaena socialis]|eukprot:PNH07037.1 hypothetical protein TSOC_006553 [Tetrabaena socialis]